MTKMKTPAPTQKVAFGAIAGAITTLVVWLCNAFLKVEIPAGVAAALTTIFTFIISYFTPPGAGDTLG